MRLVFDIETDGLLDSVTKIHSLAIYDLDTKVLKSYCDNHPDYSCIREGLIYLHSAEMLVGHNILNYDLEVLKKLKGFTTNAKVRDTMLLTRLIWPDIRRSDIAQHELGRYPSELIGRHSLEAWGVRLGFPKGTYGKSENAWERWSPEMQEYCERDTMLTAKLWEKIEPRNYSETAIQLEHDFARIIEQQVRFGFPFNVKKAAELQQVLVKRRNELTEELQQVFPPTVTEMKTPAFWIGHLGPKGNPQQIPNTAKFDTKKQAAAAGAWGITRGPNRKKITPFNPGSRDQIADRMKAMGWKPKKFTDGGKPQIDETVLEEIGTPQALKLNEYLTVDKRLGQLAEGDEAWLKLERNGRIHGSVISNGTNTGRCAHFKPNISQVPKVGSPYGTECRSLFTVDPGFVQVGCDASGLELRMLCHYLTPYDGGAYTKIVLEGDVHTENQKMAGLDSRNEAKTFIYRLLYGAGDELLGFGDRKRGAELRAMFMENMPAYVLLARDVKAAAKRNGYLKGIDGRLVPVRSLHSALNALLQSAGSIAVKKATVILHHKLQAEGLVFGREYAQLAHAHDEFQLQSRPELAQHIGETAVQAIREAGTFFGFRLPLDGEYKIGSNWAETH